MKNKKGSFEVIDFMVFAFAGLLFLALFVYVFGIMDDSFSGIISDSSSGVNLSEVGENTFGQVNTALGVGTKLLSLTLLVGMTLSIFVNAFLNQKPAITLIVDLLILLVAVPIAVALRNNYESLMTGQVFSTTLVGFKGASSIMLNLPTWIVVTGFIATIISIIGIQKRRNEVFLD